LPREELLRFITKVIDDPWEFGYDSITRCLQVVGVLRPGQILTGDDVLTLMELCVSCSSYRFVEHMRPPLQTEGLPLQSLVC
jgi:hypothetical protein